MKGDKPRKVFHIDIQKLSKKELKKLIKKITKSFEKNRVYETNLPEELDE